MEELARLMNYRGNVAIMVGELASNGAQLRTKAVESVVAKYPGLKIVEKQVGNFQRERGLDLMNNWMTAGANIDAVAAKDASGRSSAVALERTAHETDSGSGSPPTSSATTHTRLLRMQRRWPRPSTRSTS